jgi:nitrogen fixation protein NifU and related proteins
MTENLDPNYAGDGMYRENIIDHYKNPHNHGTIEDADIKFAEHNPFCGDLITITIKLEKNNIRDIKFDGKGCAISHAAASMLTDEVMGKPLEEVKKINREHVVNMLGIEVGPVRTKCAVLGLAAMREGIKRFENKKVSK